MRAKANKTSSRFRATPNSQAPASPGVRNNYAGHLDGVAGWYRDYGAIYRNPHAAAVSASIGRAVADWPELFIEPGRILDFCCGSGEVTRALIDCGIDAHRIDATDPFTSDAYAESCAGRSTIANWTFADIEKGAAHGHRWTTIVCSYALHLCEHSRLAGVCTQLSALANHLVILTPNKRPELRESWGFRLTEEVRDRELRIRVRRYDGCT